jgi:hypothetical protein
MRNDLVQGTTKLTTSARILNLPAPTDADLRWMCAYCGEWYVVPTLARICESKH